MASCNSFINPLDLQCLLVNTFSGNWLIFSIVSVLVILILAGKFRMPNFAVGGVLMLFSVMFYGQMPWFTYLTVLIGSIVIWSIVANIVKR